ncbi:cytochrome P450 4C1-like [Prorops nasuta]|uniref:cytochrome P450 4C1-like n=1 Tax=Prorops nasuta TaxID=863751 RepID=UPI0034CD1429
MEPTSLLFLVILALAIILSINILQSIYNACIYRIALNKIPGPGLPFFGLTYIGITATKEGRFKILHDYCLKYPAGIFRTWILFEGNVHIYKPDYMEDLITSTKEITKSFVYDFLLPWLGTGLLTSTGEKWFHSRKLITPTFHFNILEKFAVVMSEKTELMIKHLEEKTTNYPKKAVDVFPYATKCALDTICETAMGINIDAQADTDQENEYSKALYTFSEITFYRFFRPWLKPDWIFKQTKLGKEYFNAIKTMHRFTEKVIRRRQAVRKVEHSTDNSKENNAEADEFLGKQKRKAFLDLLLDASEKDSNPLSLTELREQVDTFMFAGHDTTGVAITWALFCLGNEPEVQERVHDELRDVFGDSKKPATTKELTELKYLDRVLKEVLRLFPSAPTVSRKLIDDTKIAGYVVPKGTTITFDVYSTHRNPEFWPNPDKFDPDRFLPENSKGRHPYAYIPFSAGPRNCIGQKYALLELKTAVTAILRIWRLKSVKTYDTIDLHAAIILRPSNGVNIYFTRKD